MNIYALDYNTHKAHNDGMKDLYCGFMYLHGKLEELNNGYDIFAIKESNRAKLMKNGSGIENVTVIMYDGTKVNADFYYWTVWNGEILKGLVVLPDDTESIEYAKEMLHSKSEFL